MARTNRWQLRNSTATAAHFRNSKGPMNDGKTKVEDNAKHKARLLDEDFEDILPNKFAGNVLGWLVKFKMTNACEWSMEILSEKERIDILFREEEGKIKAYSLNSDWMSLDDELYYRDISLAIFEKIAQRT